ncbi:hypothetical protein FACS1894159_07540 [Bacteroidia bacterium]|nr:hypothetical protein FACS1894159_07540 [Bacteroidia bacterium]
MRLAASGGTHCRTSPPQPQAKGVTVWIAALRRGWLRAADLYEAEKRIIVRIPDLLF